MVGPLGHLGMALVWLSVARTAYGRRAAMGFVVLGLPFGLFPDIDLYLPRLFRTIHHHGITHTILFVSVSAVVFGAAIGRWVVPRLEAAYVPASELGSRYAYAVGAVWVAMLSHLFADTLSAPDIAQPLELFWPVTSYTVGYDVVYYNSQAVNVGLLLGGLGLTAALWWWDVSAESPAEV